MEVSAKRYRYIGKERDEETRLYHCGARYLAAWLGRWTAADPIGLGDGVNRYAYARGNPVRLVDPGGRAATGPGVDQTTQELLALEAGWQLENEFREKAANAPALTGVAIGERAKVEGDTAKARTQEWGHTLGLESTDRPTELPDWLVEKPPEHLSRATHRAPAETGAYWVYEGESSDYAHYFDEQGNEIGRVVKEEGGPALESPVVDPYDFIPLGGGGAGVGRRALTALGRRVGRKIGKEGGKEIVEQGVKKAAKRGGATARSVIAGKDLPKFPGDLQEAIVANARLAKGKTTRAQSLLEKRTSEGAITGVRPTQANAEQIISDVLANPSRARGTERLGQLDLIGESFGQEVAIRINLRTGQFIRFGKVDF